MDGQELTDKFFSLLGELDSKQSCSSNRPPRETEKVKDGQDDVKHRKYGKNLFDSQNNRRYRSKESGEFKQDANNDIKHDSGRRGNNYRGRGEGVNQEEFSENRGRARFQRSKNNYAKGFDDNHHHDSSVNSGHDRGPVQHKIRPMGYKKLESLLNEERKDLITALANPRTGFQVTLNDRPIRPDLLILIVRVLRVVSDCEMHHLKTQILTEALKPEFIDEIKTRVSLICIEDNKERLKLLNDFFANTISLFGNLIDILPSHANDKMKSVMVALNVSMKNAKNIPDIHIDDSLFDKLKDVTDAVNSYVEIKKKDEFQQREKNKSEGVVPNKFRDIPLVPTVEDFSSSSSFLRRNIVRGAYSDCEHYLDTQFRLLREDFIAPLREGIHDYVVSLSAPYKQRKFNNVRIYPKVQFMHSTHQRDTYGYIINFDVDKKLPKYMVTNWDFNKRFMVGSLLMFSDNDFQSFFLATVIDRNAKQLESLHLSIAPVSGTPVPEYLFVPGTFFVMAESEVYYEAYRPVLGALKRMNDGNFPMKQYIVEVDTHCFPPAHLVQNSTYNISGFSVDVIDDKSWPTPDQLKLNPTQHNAFKSALTNDFAVIQGPPGTGKTFLALKIAEVLLKNNVSSDTPIVVVCYTNHALDQFLEGILKFTDNVIRIGSQSQNELLQKYSIEVVRKKLRENRQFRTDANALFKINMAKKFELTQTLQLVEKKVDDLSNPRGIFDLDILRTVITAPQFNELRDQVIEWLLCTDIQDIPNAQLEPFSGESVGKNAPLRQEQPDDIFQNTSEFQEELDEIDDEENARRLADLTEDDFYEEEDFIKAENYASNLKYAFNICDLLSEMSSIQRNLNEYPHEKRNSVEWFYFQRDSQQLLDNMSWRVNYVQSQLQRFSGLKFNPEKFYALQNLNVWDISGNDRWELYMTWVHLYTCQLKQAIQVLTNNYQETLMKLNELKQLEDSVFVKKAHVIGLTTSGAAKRRVLLENLNSKIVIVEEAAEVLEAHIVTSLSQSVQHVILIGDHKQLRPSPSVFKLAKQFNMDVSLFERMLNNGLGCSVLGVQHRMRPEIASLVCPTIYPRLDNHPSTMDRKKISGVDKFLFFLSHNMPEDQLPDSSSRQNKHEAEFLMALCQYFINQGYEPSEITILATYSGQVWYMRKEKRRLAFSNPGWHQVRITPVDNFQGEENRIILLSLVRSNAEARIGFLSTENRVCVALSRARDGFYIIGNMDNLTASSAIWPKIKEQLENNNAVGDKLTLRCERHPDQLIHASSAKDFAASPEGGCKLMCEARLKCGHTCPRVCHIIDKEHGFYRCQKPCDRPPCDMEGHRCPLKCHEDCKPCKIVVKRELTCGHLAKLPCHVEPASALCMELVPATLPACGHEVQKMCHQELTKVNCTSDCTIRLPCGHSCNRKCHVNDDPDHLEYKCRKDCPKPNVGCRRNMHPCTKRCYEECGECMVKMLTKLACGHQEGIPCSQDGSKVMCKKPCKNMLPCGHKCPLQCWLPCDSKACDQKVDKVAKCGHTFKGVPCNKSVEEERCKAKCSRNLACGHACPNKCMVDCATVACNIDVESSKAPACGHPAPKIPCRLNKPELQAGSDELVELCKAECRERLPCGHNCTGICGSCMQGRLHVPCLSNCGKTLICGHRCKGDCSELCPPCRDKDCFNNCDHHRCNKQHSCSQPCNPCKKPCKWSCEHFKCTKQCGEECNRPPCDEACLETLKCGHPCIGYCGEAHPTLCRECDADDEVIMANPDGRFVLLVDCGHTVDVDLLNVLIDSATSDAVSRLIRCPYCDKPVVRAVRCRNAYIRFRQQMVNISKLVNDEFSRLKKQIAPNVSLLMNNPTASDSMNRLLKECVKSQKGHYKQEFTRVIVGCLLIPMVREAMKIDRFSLGQDIYQRQEIYQRIVLRMEYLANLLRLRLVQISYTDIQQIELEVGRLTMILKTLHGETSLTTAVPTDWYDVSKYMWANNRASMKRFSVTLRTRDASRHWYLCKANHLYVNDDEESCIDCVEIERANSWADSCEDFPFRMITKGELDCHSSLPPVAGIMSRIKKRNNKKRGQWQKKEQPEERSIMFDEAGTTHARESFGFDENYHNNSNFEENQKYHYKQNNWRREPSWKQDTFAQERQSRWNRERMDGWRSQDSQPPLLPTPPLQPGFDPFYDKDSRRNERDWKRKNKQTYNPSKKKNRKK